MWLTAVLRVIMGIGWSTLVKLSVGFGAVSLQFDGGVCCLALSL